MELGMTSAQALSAAMRNAATLIGTERAGRIEEAAVTDLCASRIPAPWSGDLDRIVTSCSPAMMWQTGRLLRRSIELRIQKREEWASHRPAQGKRHEHTKGTTQWASRS